MVAWIRIVVVLAGLVCWSGVGWSEVVDRIVAQVNDSIILQSDLDARIKLLEKASEGKSMDELGSRSEVERKVLQQIIWDRLSEQEAERLEIKVDDNEVDRAIERFKKKYGLVDTELEVALRRDGQNMEGFRDNMRKQIVRARLVQRVLKSKAVVTEQQVDDYMAQGGGKSAPSRPKTTETGGERHLAVIFLPAPAGDTKQAEKARQLATKIRERALGGEDFSGLAKQYSKGPAAEDGGDIGFMAVSDLAGPVAEATHGLRPGDISEVVTVPDGFYVLKVLEVRGGSTTQVASADTEESSPATTDRDRAREELMQIEMNRKYQDWIQDLEKRSFIRIHLQ